MRREFSALERRVLDAIMRYTYAAGKTEAEVTTEDVRLMIEGEVRVRTDRINAVLVKLTEQNVLKQRTRGTKILTGLQKDFELWVTAPVDKVSMSLKGLSINYNTNSRRVVDKMSTLSSTPEQLLAYSQKTSGFQHGATAWRTERSWANKLYKRLLTNTNDAERAGALIVDYIDENEWMRKNVQRQFAYMYSRFDQWLAQIPRKPRDVRESEEATGRRYRYDTKLKQWIPAIRRELKTEV